MKKAQGLKTLGDYRRAAKDSLFSIYLPPTSKSTSDYDAIKTALEHFKTIIRFSRSNFSERDWWKGGWCRETKYEMINPTLFECIKLMEFAIKYHEVKSINELYPAWPKRPEPNAKFFAIFGDSYLKVGFKMVCKQGSDIIDILQNAYLEYKLENKKENKKEDKKEDERPYVGLDPFIFLNKTPKVDELKINPEPDRIIKTWFDNMMKGTKSGFPESEYPRHRVETEFNLIDKQLDHEWNLWKKPGEKEPQNLMALTIIPKYFEVTEKTLRRRTGEGKRFTNYPDADGTMRLDTKVVAQYYHRLTDSQKK